MPISCTPVIVPSQGELHRFVDRRRAEREPLLREQEIVLSSDEEEVELGAERNSGDAGIEPDRSSTEPNPQDIAREGGE